MEASAMGKVKHLFSFPEFKVVISHQSLILIYKGSEWGLLTSLPCGQLEETRQMNKWLLKELSPVLAAEL
jgi:hypothetical protein